MPWNPAKFNQRIGRINRIFQKSQFNNVIKLIAQNIIEERIMAGINLKENLFSGVFDGGKENVLLSRGKRREMVNRLREMILEQGASPIIESLPAEKPAEDTPHFLYPEALNNEVVFTGKETVENTVDQGSSEDAPGTINGQWARRWRKFSIRVCALSAACWKLPPEKLAPAGGHEKMVTFDKKTGEVALKFTLPGF